MKLVVLYFFRSYELVEWHHTNTGIKEKKEKRSQQKWLNKILKIAINNTFITIEFDNSVFNLYH